MMSPTFARIAIAGALALSTMVTGCSSMGIGPGNSLRTMDRMNTHGANALMDNEKFEVIDLIATLDPLNMRKDLIRQAAFKNGRVESRGWHTFRGDEDARQSTTDQDSYEAAQDRVELEFAFVAFHDVRYAAYGTVEERRNRLQDRLIAASNNRCEAYKVYLKRFESYMDSGFGIATTVMAGAAAVATGGNTPRALAALAGMSSGVRSEIRQGMMANLASYVIVPGIDTKRDETLKRIKTARSASNTDGYTVQAALADVASYHGACTLETGLEKARDQIQLAQNPGLAMMQKTMNNALQLRQMGEAFEQFTKERKITPEIENLLRLRSFSADGEPVSGVSVNPVTAFAHAPSTTSASPANLVNGTYLGLISQIRSLQDELAIQKTQLEALQSNPETASTTATVAEVTASLAQLASFTGSVTAVMSDVKASLTSSLAQAATTENCLRSLVASHQSAGAAERQKAAAEMDYAKASARAPYQNWTQLTAINTERFLRSARALAEKLTVSSVLASQKTISDGGKGVDWSNVNAGLSLKLEALPKPAAGAPCISTGG